MTTCARPLAFPRLAMRSTEPEVVPPLMALANRMRPCSAGVVGAAELLVVDDDESEDPSWVTGGVVLFDPGGEDELAAGGRAITDGGQVKTVPGCTLGSDDETIVQVGWPVTGS